MQQFSIYGLLNVTEIFQPLMCSIGYLSHNIKQRHPVTESDSDT